MSFEIVYGRHAVFHLIAAGRRRAISLHLQKGMEDPSSFLEIARQKGIPVRLEEPSFFPKRAGPGATHQGVLVETEAYPYLDPGLFLSSSLLLILDELTDPQNVGALCRTACLFGVDGVILPENRSAAIGPGTCQAAAGSVEYLKIGRVSTVAGFLELLKRNHFWTYGAAPDGTQDLNNEQFPEKIALVVGSEEKGLRKLVRERCDILLKIPMVPNPIGSLNVSVAGGVLLSQIFRQRQKGSL